MTTSIIRNHHLGIAPENQGLTEDEIVDRIWNPENPHFLGTDPTTAELVALVPDYPADWFKGPAYKIRTEDDRHEDRPRENDGGYHEPTGIRRDDSPSAAQRMYLLRLVYEAAPAEAFAVDNSLAPSNRYGKLAALALDETVSKKNISKAIEAIKEDPERRKTYAASRDLNDSNPIEAAKTLETRLIEKISENQAPKEEKPLPEAKTEAAAEGVAPIDGYYTVVLDGEHRTLRIKTAGDNSRLAGSRIISFLSGANNETDYTGFGFVNGDRVNLWKRFQDDTVLVEAVRVLLGDPKAAAGKYALESNNCYVCGRTLTTPESIESGIGPICESKGW